MRRLLALALMVLGVLTATVAVITTPAASAVEPAQGVRFDWTGGGGDHLWSNPANWTNDAGAIGTPGAADAAWIGGLSDPPVIVDVPVTVAHFNIGAPIDGVTDLSVDQPMVSSNEWWAFGDVEVRADVTAPNVVLSERIAIIDSTVRISAPADPARRPMIGVVGRIELQGSGRLVSDLSGGVDVSLLAYERAVPTEIIGVPTFRNAHLVLDDDDVAGTLDLVGTTAVSGIIHTRLELRLRPDERGAIGLIPHPESSNVGSIINVGTVTVQGGHPDLTPVTIASRFVNYGTLRFLGRSTLSGGQLTNGGSVAVEDRAIAMLAAAPDGEAHRNPGRIELQGGGALYVSGPFVNDGQIDRTARPDGSLVGLFVTRTGPYSGTGGGTAWFYNEFEMTPGNDLPEKTPVPVGRLTNEANSRLRLRASGPEAAQVQRLDVATSAELDGTLAVVLDGEVPCPGTTLELLRWASYDRPFATVEAEGGPSWMRLEPVYSPTGLSVTVGGVPDDGTCGDDADDFVREVYLDVLGRPVDPGAFTYWGDRLRAGTTRMEVASGLTSSLEYRRRQVTDEYLRFLDRRPDRAGLRYWADQLASGRSLDTLRAVLLGSTEAWSTAGTDPSRFADLVYRTVLLRTADPDGRAFVVDQLAAGRSRASVASWYVRSREGDRRQLKLYWQQLLHASPTSRQISAWADALATQPEATVVARIAGSDTYAGSHAS